MTGRAAREQDVLRWPPQQAMIANWTRILPTAFLWKLVQVPRPPHPTPGLGPRPPGADRGLWEDAEVVHTSAASGHCPLPPPPAPPEPRSPPHLRPDLFDLCLSVSVCLRVSVRRSIRRHQGLAPLLPPLLHVTQNGQTVARVRIPLRTRPRACVAAPSLRATPQHCNQLQQSSRRAM